MDNLPKDEIDLQDLAVRIIRFFKANFLFILITCAAGIGLGVAAYKSLPSIYESKMIVLSDILTRTYGERIDESLNNLIGEGNSMALSAKLNLTPQEASVITSISVECIVEVNPQKEAVDKDETYFIVTVDLKDKSVLPRLQEGLLHFFRNNDFVKVRADQRRRMYEGLLLRIDKELSSMDSLKRELSRGTFRGHIADPSGMYSTGVEIAESQWKYKNGFELANGIFLVEGFTVFEKPRDPKLLTLAFLGFVLGLLFSVGVLTIRQLFILAR